jgi:hypothetical protein
MPEEGRISPFLRRRCKVSRRDGIQLSITQLVLKVRTEEPTRGELSPQEVIKVLEDHQFWRGLVWASTRLALEDNGVLKSLRFWSHMT